MRRSDIDDAPRTAQSLFDRLAGPEPSKWELALTAIALVGTVGVAHADALPSWSHSQYATAIALAVIDGSAAVQCATAQSKRWYHPLTPRLASFIALEAVVQCALIGWMYCETEGTTFAVAGSTFFAVASAALFACPLHAQRPLSLLPPCPSPPCCPYYYCYCFQTASRRRRPRSPPPQRLHPH